MLMDRNEIKKICLNEIKNLWMEAPDSFPTFLAEVTMETKIENELYINNISDCFQKAFKNFPNDSKKRKKWKQRVLAMIDDILKKEKIGGINNVIGSDKMEIFKEELKEFIVSARKFAPKLPMTEIGQGLRNYIVYETFIEINQGNTGFNRACFGYSMLYPLTDNYIDSPNYSDNEKIEYNKIIREKIEGKKVSPKSFYEEKTCELLSMIEEKYPRGGDSTIFTLLLMMLEAQEDSLRQQNKDGILSYKEILDISLYKGCMSVLIDGFFTKEEMSKEDMIFYLSFGFFLQLVDDLQDIVEDSEKGHQTIITADLYTKSIEKTVNKMFHFLDQILNEYNNKSVFINDFFRPNCYELICSSIIFSKDFFSQRYIEKIEKYMIVSFDFMEAMQKKQQENKNIEIQDKYMEILDEMIY